MLEALELAVLRKALEGLEGLARFPAPGYPSLNVSPETILAGHVHELFSGLPLERIVLEVTEHASVTDYPRAAQRLAGLRKGGLRLAVDGADAGFAIFRHILSVEPDIIKLDDSLIHRIDVDRGRRALTATLILLAEEVGSRVVAEGVETTAEFEVMRELNVSEAQGLLLGPPGHPHGASRVDYGRMDARAAASPRLSLLQRPRR